MRWFRVSCHRPPRVLWFRSWVGKEIRCRRCGAEYRLVFTMPDNVPGFKEWRRIP